MKYIIYILILMGGSLQAQDEPFRGGPGDGFATDSILNSFNVFFKGGTADGYASGSVEDTFNVFYRGGTSDGYAYGETTDLFNDFSRGGMADGYASGSLENTFNDVFKGGGADGYSSANYGHIIVWTGLVGTGWNVSGNWENDLIPTSCNPVIIPAGVPNFPFVNSGLLEIGEHNNDGDYRCQQLKINQNAELTTRVNCFVENRNLLLVRGNFFVKNPNSQAFKNLNGAEVIIKPTGELVILP